MKVYYDEQFDILEIFVQDPQPAVTVGLEEDVYAHVLPLTKQLIGISVHHFRERHPESALPFSGTLNPVSPQVAKDIDEALSPT